VAIHSNAINSGNREKKDGATSEATGTRPMEEAKQRRSESDLLGHRNDARHLSKISLSSEERMLFYLPTATFVTGNTRANPRACTKSFHKRPSNFNDDIACSLSSFSLTQGFFIISFPF
jgi:hypothetical protein